MNLELRGVFRLSCEARLGDCTAEAQRTQSKKFLVKKFSDLCELCASAVNTSSQKTRNNHIEKAAFTASFSASQIQISILKLRA
jgi:hypothetical protein